MKRLLTLILALAVLLAAGTVLAEDDDLQVLSCPEAGFSTRIPAGATWTYGDDAVMVWLAGEGYVPNIWIYPRGSKLSDPVGFMHETYPEYMEQQYGDRLRSVSRYEYYEIAGMQLNAVGFIYESSQGNNINELNLVLPLDSQDVEFELRYPNSDRETSLAALETVIRYFRPDADYYSASHASPDTAPQASAGSAPAETGSAEILSCPQAGFSTKIPAGATWEYDDGDVYVWLEDQGSVPNIWIYPRGSKLNDPVSFMHVKYPEYMKSEYGDNLRATSTMEYYEIAGLKLTAVSFIYQSPNGFNINQMNLVLPLDTQDVEFQVRYMNDERDMTLAALETAVRYFQPDADYYSKPQASSDAAPQVSSGSAAAAHSFTVTNVKQDDMIIGRCVAPAGYTVSSNAYCCTTAQSAGNPWLLGITASSPEGIALIYSSARDYYTRPVDGNDFDEQFNANFMTPMLHYMTAAEYCDYWAQKMFQDDVKIELVDENTYPEQQAMLRQKEEADKKMYNSQTAGIGPTISKVEYSLGARCYYVETSGGLRYYLVIATATNGVWNEVYMPGPIVDISESYILWGSPYLYVMSCPADLWEANADIFPVFMENTSVNDQFLLANQRISDDIWSMLTGIDLVGGTEYSRKVMKETTSAGNDYNDERFTDYIYDQNDYTLSDGTHVKISTAYDYVYEGDNGVVYYSDSAFSQPGGSTQLTPNR